MKRDGDRLFDQESLGGEGAFGPPPGLQARPRLHSVVDQRVADDLAVSAVVPAYNEEELLAHSVTELVTGLRTRGSPFEVIVVENGSLDGTRTVAEKLAADMPEVVLISLPDADYGRALRAGLLSARGTYVANFDADFFDLGFLDAALADLATPGGPAIVVGTKRGPGSNDTRAWPRRMVTAVFSTILRTGFGLGVSDTHGMKAMRRADVVDLAERCQLGTDLFDTELVLRAERAGRRAVEIPVTVQELRPARSSMLRRVPRTIRNLVRLRLLLWREPIATDPWDTAARSTRRNLTSPPPAA